MTQLVPAHLKKSKGRTDRDRLLVGEQILDGRNKGRKMVEICQDLGIGTKTGYRYLDMVIASRIVPTIDEYRKIENERLDQIEREVSEQMEVSERLAKMGVDRANPDLILRSMTLRDKALARRLSIAERRAKLNGLDAPVQVQATVTHLSDVDAELAAMVAEAERRLAEDEAGDHGGLG